MSTITDPPSTPQRLPSWIRARFPGGPNYLHLKNLLREEGLHTVCEEARCPNMGECWEWGTATFLILGDICTRACGYCAIKTGLPTTLDLAEPNRVAQTVEKMKLRHAVITSVDRDDLPDGGAGIFAATIQQIRAKVPGCNVEVLIPDFKGSRDALATVMAAKPDILNHNTETVPRLYRKARSGGIYTRALELLRRAREIEPKVITKTALSLG